MSSPNQSSALWVVLAGVVAISCAGREQEGLNPSGSGATGGSGAPSGNGGSPGSAGSGTGSSTGVAGDGGGNSSGATGTGNGTGTGGAGSGSGGTGSTTNPTLLPVSVRRLTNAEYDAAVAALLGTTQTPSTNFPPDSRQNGGYTLNDAQRVDPVLVKALDDAATALVAEARGNGKLAALAPCSNPSTMGATCAATFINAFGAKAYRRPLASAETTSLTTLYQAGANGGTHNDGIDLVTRGILQSAGFLYVTQLGAAGAGGSTITLTQNEVANTLSFLTTAAPPDQTLLDMASSNGLSAPDAREAQVRRLLSLPTGKTRMLRVVREWLGLDETSQLSKDASVYPKFTDAIRTSVDAENVSFINEVLQNSTGTVSELLGANWSIIDSGLASIYGVTSAGANKRTTLPKRIGILNQAGFLGRFAKAQESSPVLRGVAVMRRVACITVPDPTSLNIIVVPPLPDATKSTRDRFDIHSKDAACASCHTAIDAIGFAFELFDGMGVQRPAGSQAGMLKDDNGVNTSASTTVSGSAFDFAGSYADSNALATALAASPQVRECMARQMFRAAVGGPRYVDSDVRKAEDRFASAEQSFVAFWKQLPSGSQGTFKEALVAYVRSPLFDQRSAP